MVENSFRMIVEEFEQNESGIASSEISVVATSVVVTRAISIQTEKCTQISLNPHFFVYWCCSVYMQSKDWTYVRTSDCERAYSCTRLIIRSFACLFNSFDNFFTVVFTWSPFSWLLSSVVPRCSAMSGKTMLLVMSDWFSSMIFVVVEPTIYTNVNTRSNTKYTQSEWVRDSTKYNYYCSILWRGEFNR